MTLPWRDILRRKDDDWLKCVHAPALGAPVNSSQLMEASNA
jgi:hypothetical protein